MLAVNCFKAGKKKRAERRNYTRKKTFFTPSKLEEEFERQPLRGSEGAKEGCPRL